MRKIVDHELHTFNLFRVTWQNAWQPTVTPCRAPMRRAIQHIAGQIQCISLFLSLYSVLLILYDDNYYIKIRSPAFRFYTWSNRGIAPNLWCDSSSASGRTENRKKNRLGSSVS